MLVIPAQARPVGLGHSPRQILTPTSALGFGTAGVALWVETTPQPGVRVVIPFQQVAAVGTEHILLSARLTIRSTAARLTARYNAVADDQLRPLMLDLRRRTAVCAAELPTASDLGMELPYKCRRLLEGHTPRLYDGEPVAGRLPVPRRTEPAHAVVALTVGKLVVLTDPVHSAALTVGDLLGVDAHHIPRAGIETVRVAGASLRVLSRRVNLELPLGADLATGVVEAFAGYLPVALAD
ncbi:hypothetical protein ABZU94_08695 [Streptomyces mirabilis]|uniref:hypothetical protein n=1 Tax=Streptomyces sp. NPDC005388 TaxID=3156717 RepID=UPI0033B47BFA